MSYGPDFKESFERAASLVDRIFKGAKPASFESTPGAYAANSSIGSTIEKSSFSGLLTRV